MFASNGRFDLKRAVFSTEGSCIAIHEEYPTGQLFMTFNRVSPWFLLKRRTIVKLIPTKDGREVDYTYRATPEELVLDTEFGSIGICIPEKELIRIKGTTGVGLRLVVEPEPHESLCNMDYGCVEMTLSLSGRMLMVPIDAVIAGYAPCSGRADRPCYMLADMLPGKTGIMDVAIHCVTREMLRREKYEDYEVCKEKVRASFEDFCKKYPPVPGEYEEMARYAMYTIWSHRLAPSETSVVQGTIVEMHRLWLSHGFAWQQSYNAMAIRSDPAEAWRLIKTMFDYQLDSGMLPDWVDYYTVNYLACKPGIQGFALAFLLENSDIQSVLTPEECEKMYDPFCKWAGFWLKHRASDREGVVRYFHADESGWDEATIFSKGLPVEAPDLLAFVIYLMEACSRLAKGCGKEEEAKVWQDKDDFMLKKLIEEFWDGEQFVARQPGTGDVVPSRSIACYQPIILGKRLPQEIIDKIAAAVTDENEYMTAVGLTGEAMTSPECTYSILFMKGRVVAPVNMLMSVGLYGAGKVAEAKRIAKAFCDKVNQEGMLLGYSPSEIEPATGLPVQYPMYPTPLDSWPWSSWTAANFLIMASTILND